MPTHLEQQYQQLCLRGIDEMGSGIPRITLGSIVSAGDLLIQFNFGIPFLHDAMMVVLLLETSNSVLHKYATRYIFLLILN